MYAYIAGVIIFCLAVIFVIYYRNILNQEQKIQQAALLEEEKQRLEMVRLRQQRHGKRLQEKENAEKLERENKLRNELAPMFDQFLGTYNIQDWLPNMHFATMILEGYPMTLKEFLQHNVVRRFPDGSSYKVGIAKIVSDADISLYPETVEKLQEYFIAFLELNGSIRNRNIFIERQQLHQLLWEKMEQTRNKIV